MIYPVSLLHKIEKKLSQYTNNELHIKHKFFKDETSHIGLYVKLGKRDKLVYWVTLDEAVFLTAMGVTEVN